MLFVFTKYHLIGIKLAFPNLTQNKVKPMLPVFENCHRHFWYRSTPGQCRTDARVQIGSVNQTER